MIKDKCVFCGDKREYEHLPWEAYSYDEAIRKLRAHYDDCFMYKLWQRNNPALMVFKEHLIERQKII